MRTALRLEAQRVLTFGILAALVLRAIFIALGAALLATISAVLTRSLGAMRRHRRVRTTPASAAESHCSAASASVVRELALVASG